MRNQVELSLLQQDFRAMPTFIPDASSYKPTDRKIGTEVEASLLRKPRREKLGSDAFNLEYDTPPTRAELRRDIVSYLGEYRLQVQKHNYDLVFGRDKDHRGDITLRDIDRGPSLHHMAKKTLESRTLEGKPTHREEAEKQGLELLNEQLRSSKEGDTVLWASPPGPKEQGYGDYGFIYAGKVHMLDNGERQVAMTAIRIEKPLSLEQDNGRDPWTARIGDVITILSGQPTSCKTAEDFLATPLIIKREVTDRMIDRVLQESFDFVPNDQEQKQTEAIIKKMDPLIEEFISRMETGSKEERLKAFYVLENYALALKDQEEKESKQTVIYEKAVSLDSLAISYGHMPPPMAGSCGSTGGVKSNGIASMSGSNRLSSYLLNSSESSSDMKCVTCPFCKEMVDAVVTATTITCPECKESVNR